LTAGEKGGKRMKQMTDPKIVLMTRVEYDACEALAQGFVVYMQAEHPGSELKGLHNPYPRDSENWKRWNRGQAIACQAVTDVDDEG
jgi:hypothetical protein